MAGVSPWDLGLCWTLHGLRQADDRSGLRVSSNFHIQGLSAVRQWGASLKKLGEPLFQDLHPEVPRVPEKVTPAVNFLG